MIRMIESFEDAVGCYFTGNGIYWKVISYENGRFKFQYCNKLGEKTIDMEIYNWVASLKDINDLYCRELNKNSQEIEKISPIIRKIRKMEARFNQRTASV
jgi:hypothetical protein